MSAMALRDRVFRVTDAPMTWARAILIGTGIFVLGILFLGQVPSWIIYKFDQEVALLIEWSAKVPGVADEGLNTIQIKIVRDLVANAVQNGFLIMMLVAAYYWQKMKLKRTGRRNLEDPIKGYLPGK